MTQSTAGTGSRRKPVRGAAYAIPVSDGSIVPAIVRGTGVLFGGCALALVHQRVLKPADLGRLSVTDQDDILAFLITHPHRLENGSWPLLTKVVEIAPSVEQRLIVGKMTDLVVHPVSDVIDFLEACMGLRDWDQPFGVHIPQHAEALLFPGRTRPSTARRGAGPVRSGG